MNKPITANVFQKTMMVLACVTAMGVTQAADAAENRLKVVASFSILADLVANVGGDDIELSTIVGRDADAHGFEPTPKDVRKLSDADLLFVNGLQFEGWLPRLVEASGFQGKTVVVSEGVMPLAFAGHGGEHGHAHDHDHGHGAEKTYDHGHEHHGHEQAVKSEHEHGHDHDHGSEHEHAHGHDHAAVQDVGLTHHHHGNQDPHAWQDPTNAIIYVQNIARGLSQADPANAASYRSRAEAYITEIRQLDQEIRQSFARIPESQRKVVTSHDAFGYFAKAYGIQFFSAVGVSTQAEASAQDVAKLIDQMRSQGFKAVFVENVTNPRLVEQMASETGARMGGTLYSDALAPEGTPAGTYLGMLRWNAKQLLDALK